MVFDQGQARRSDPHLLDILEENFPERYRDVLRRLMRASSEQDIREGMDVEDEVLTTLQDRVREIEEKNKDHRGEGEGPEGRRTKALEEQAKALEEQAKALEEKDQALEEKEQVLGRQNRLIGELQRRLGRD